MTSTASGPASSRGPLLLLVTAVLWSTNGVLIKELQAAGLSGVAIAAARSLVAGVFLAPFAFKRWRPIAEPAAMAFTVLLFTAMSASFVVATTRTTAANAIILQYTAPAWVFALSPLIVGERATARQWIAFAAAMIAVLFIFAMQFNTDRAGLLIGLLSGVVFGTQVVFFRRVRAVDPVVVAFLCCAGSAAVLTPLAAAGVNSLAAKAVALALLMGVVQFGLPYVLYAAGSRLVTAQTAVLIIMLEPVLNPVWVYLVRGEIPHWSTIAGGALILAAAMYLSLSRD